MDAIVAMQKAVPVPSGEKDIALATDEPPEDISVFPSFVNVEEVTDVTHGASRRQETHIINMHLLFEKADVTYSVRSRRAWIKNVRDTFDTNLRLFLATVAQCHYARVSRVEYHDDLPFNTPLAIGDHEYNAATFVLEVLVDGAFAYSSGS